MVQVSTRILLILAAKVFCYVDQPVYAICNPVTRGPTLYVRPLSSIIKSDDNKLAPATARTRQCPTVTAGRIHKFTLRGYFLRIYALCVVR